MDDIDRATATAEVPEDEARDSKTIGELIADDIADPTTPSFADGDGAPAGGFEVPLRPFLETNPAMLVETDRPLTMGSSTNVAKMKRVATRLRGWGFTVLMMDGWENRGRPDIALTANWIGAHHTAAVVDVDRILRDGRPDVSGPLANYGVHRNSDIILIASGRANHFGVATIRSSDAWGIEATGPIPVTAFGKSAFPNYWAYIALCKAIMLEEDWAADRIKAHKEVAPKRKINPSLNMTTFRSDAAAYRGSTPPQEDDLPTMAELVKALEDPNSPLYKATLKIGRRSINSTIGAPRKAADGTTVSHDTEAAAPGNPARFGILELVERGTADLSDDEAKLTALIKGIGQIGPEDVDADEIAASLAAVLPDAVIDRLVARAQS